MDISDKYHETHHQYCVIARSRKPEAAQFRKQQIIREISDQLGPYIGSQDISYIPPNFIIYLNSPHVQRDILSKVVLHTTDFELDLLPWSKEHELSQLPWMPDAVPEDHKIIIDPLTILPITSHDARYMGPHALKDTYPLMMGNNYELKAPDFSYLMVADLRDYYYSKHDSLDKCRNIVTQIASLLQRYDSELTGEVQVIYNGIQSLKTAAAENEIRQILPLADDLRTISSNASRNSTNIYENLIDQQRNVPMNLVAFRKILPLLQVPVPQTYVDRLKIIHVAATKQAYRAEAIITTTETSTGMFETFMTTGKMTRKYDEVPLKTAATIETIAIYQSLRYITNVLGYKIVDLNYPTLSELVCDLNRQNTHMTLLQCCASAAEEHTEQLYDYFPILRDEFVAATNDLDNILHYMKA